MADAWAAWPWWRREPWPRHNTVNGDPPFVLASDNCHLYRNLAEHQASATFSDTARTANIRNQARMVLIAGFRPSERIVTLTTVYVARRPMLDDLL